MLVSARAGGGEVGSAERIHVQQTLGECSACVSGRASRARATAQKGGAIDRPREWLSRWHRWPANVSRWPWQALRQWGGRRRACFARLMHSRCVSMWGVFCRISRSSRISPKWSADAFSHWARSAKIPSSVRLFFDQPIHSVGVLVVGSRGDGRLHGPLLMTHVLSATFADAAMLVLPWRCSHPR